MALGLLKPCYLALGSLLCTHASGVVPKGGQRARTRVWEETCHSATIPHRRVVSLGSLRGCMRLLMQTAPCGSCWEPDQAPENVGLKFL